MQGTRVWALDREDPTCCRATKPMCHNYWACALEPTSHNYRPLMPQLLKTACLEPVLRNKTLQWEAHAPQRRVAPATMRKPAHAATKTQCSQKYKQIYKKKKSTSLSFYRLIIILGVSNASPWPDLSHRLLERILQKWCCALSWYLTSGEQCGPIPLLVILTLFSYHLVSASFLHCEVTTSPFVFDWYFVQRYSESMPISVPHQTSTHQP